LKHAGDVLVVEDDETLNIQICRLVRKAGFRFRGALDGESALEQAREKPPSLIILDVMLPGTDGFELCRQLKISPITRRVPVIFVTGLDDEDDRRRGIEAGASAYLVKPFRSHELTACIRSLLVKE